ncbi:MAG: 4-alpha-glucanotransferase, partial [Deltaproteobacteria bacterium]
GILLHPTSLPGPGPCGDLGPAARSFVDWLEAAGQTLWQVLPLVPPGAGLSPYDSPAGSALGTHLVSVDDLVADGLLTPADLAGRPAGGPRVDRDALEGWHRPRVDRAARRLAADDPASIDEFAETHPWVEEYALLCTLTEATGARRGWRDLPAALRDRDPRALADARRRHRDGLRRHLAAQYLVHRQWQALRRHAHARGVSIIGDLPIFVSATGADTWAHRGLFLWGSGDPPCPDPVAGVPPDYFSPTGQRWGNPMYDWDAHRAQGFAWWTRRFRAILGLVDAVRVDHFRGFVAAWAIPADAPDARSGQWVPGPGRELFDAVARSVRTDPPPGVDPDAPLPIIAEDLGIITPDVEALRDGLSLPGMKILQFAFGGGADHPFLPHNWTHDRWVAYTGTHDNDTVRGWYDGTTESVRHHFRCYVARDGREPHWQLIRLLQSSTARWAITPLQDVLGLGSDARMNVPGSAEGNWSWRATELPEAAAWRLRDMVELYGRRPAPLRPAADPDDTPAI